MRAFRILGVPLMLVLAALACNTPGSAGPTVVEATLAPTTFTVSTVNPAPTTASGGAAPTAAPQTAIPPDSAQRISFAAGATSASVQGTLSAGHVVAYVIGAAKGQTMTVNLTASGGAPTLSVAAPTGDVLKSSAVGGPAWSGPLPVTGDYSVAVSLDNGGPAAYTLQVSIPPLAQTGGQATQCWVTTANALQAMRESSPTADVFGSASAGDKTLALARTTDGWLGFDPGVAQAGNQGRARLRWYQTAGASLSFDPAGCDQKLPVVLSMQSLRNGTYHVFDLQDVKLADGQYTDPNFDFAKTGDSVHDTFIASAYAFGDLNGDGSEDAVIVLATNTGGTGTFVEIVPVLNVAGNPQPGGSIQVGDRSPVNVLSIEAGVITADVTVSGPNDAGCCPSLNQTWTIKLVNGKLVKQ